METSGQTWAIVLAAGEGSRLRSLTTTPNGAIPKQFCSLRGGRSLLHDALHRAKSVAIPRHICTIVAEQHCRWWRDALVDVPEQNVIVQPSNRGTAVGILLPLLHVMLRDPEARIVLLPSDHHVRDEAVLADALRMAVAKLEIDTDAIVMLGITPDEPDSELGYIVPGSISRDGGVLSSVSRFVEKPPTALAQSLVENGALWNAFIIAARASALLQLFIVRYPQLVADMWAAVDRDACRPNEPEATRRLYRDLGTIDFSHHVIAGAEEQLRVLPVEPCGWSDLGTPKRVADTLQRLASRTSSDADCAVPLMGYLDLAEHLAKQKASKGALHAAG